MTVSSRDPVFNPSNHRTTRTVGYSGIDRISVHVVMNIFTKSMTVLSAGVTAGTYAYEAWEWFQNIHWLW